MMNDSDEILMSQLADGELSSDQANELLLLRVLDVPAQREKLKAMLSLRQATVGWRTRQPQRPVMVVSGRTGTLGHRPITWRVGSMAAAALLGGLLVLTGIWAAGWGGKSAKTGDSGQIALRPDISPTAAQVSPEQMRQVAKVFALHESVAGPLAWYAADDRNIRLASVRGAEASQQPIGVLLKVESATPGVAARTLVIVCRNDQPAVIELPAESGDGAGLRVYLTPRTSNGKVDMQYAIAMNDQSQQAPLASLSGQRSLGLSEAPLGQLALSGDHVLNIGAAAWPMRQEHN